MRLTNILEFRGCTSLISYVWGNCVESTMIYNSEVLITVICSIIWFVTAVVSIVKPNYTWYMEYGWKYKNAEPTDCALILQRFGGIIMIVIGILFLVTG